MRHHTMYSIIINKKGGAIVKSGSRFFFGTNSGIHTGLAERQSKNINGEPSIEPGSVKQ